MDHKLILENSSSNAVNTQLNAIIFLKAVKYVNIRLRQIYCIKQTWNFSKGVKDWVWNGHYGCKDLGPLCWKLKTFW